MPLQQNFTCSQTAGLPSKITFTDTSSGSDVAVTQRRIYIQTPAGDFLVEDGTATEYEVWGGFPGTTSIVLDVLLKDWALTLTVQWLDVSGNILYDKTIKSGFTLYNETFDYQLTQMLSGNPLLINDNRFFELKGEIRTLIDSGNNAIELASDVFGAQQCYNLATDLRVDSEFYFNANE
jgi:hypothetical protein